MKVVLSGYYGFNNVGDDAILLAIVGALKSYDPAVEITVLSNDPENTKAIYGVDAINRWRMKDVYKALKVSDGLISGGGSLLQDETGIKSIIYYTGVMKIAQFLRKPVFIYAQGMGPIHTSFGKMMVRSTLKKMNITVRDEDSKTLLTELGLHKEIDIVPDPVLGLDVQEIEVSWWKKQNFQDRVLTVSVREWPSGDSSFKERIAEALDRVAAEGAKIVFIPMHGIHDYATSEEVADLMKEESYIAPYDATIQEKIAMIGNSDVLVGMRLHALIFAALKNTPFIALSYDPKIDSFATISGQPVAGHVEKDNWTGESLYEELSSLLTNLDSEKERLKVVMEPLQKKANETAVKAIEYFQHNK